MFPALAFHQLQFLYFQIYVRDSRHLLPTHDWEISSNPKVNVTDYNFIFNCAVNTPNVNAETTTLKASMKATKLG